jgi:hypothetical protein
VQRERARARAFTNPRPPPLHTHKHTHAHTQTSRALSHTHTSRQGGLNDYLDDLEKSDPSERKLEKWFYTEWLERRQRVRSIAAANAAKRAAAAANQVCGLGFKF